MLIHRIHRCLIVVALGMVASGVWSQDADVPSSEQPTAEELAERARQIAFRIDLELGELEAAQRHLLIARLNLALQDGDWDSASIERFEAWRGALESLETDTELQRLPVWNQLLAADFVSTWLDASSANAQAWTTATAQRERALSPAALTMLTNDPRASLSRSSYPRQLAWAMANAHDIWLELLQRLEQTPELVGLIEPLVASWLALPLSADLTEWQQLEDAAADWLNQSPKPVPELLASQVELLMSERLLVDGRSSSAELLLARYEKETPADILMVARALRQLPDGQFSQLAAVLQSLIAELSSMPDGDRRENYAAVLDSLAAVDSALLPQLGAVDPSLQSSYQQTRALLREMLAARSADPQLIAMWRSRSAALMAASQLAMTDLSSYLEQPLRTAINRDVTVCLRLAGHAEPLPAPVIEAGQFGDCVAALVRLANESARSPELAGMPAASYEPLQLAREASLPPWQRINYWHGWLNEQFDCELPTGLPNPLEWAIGARTLQRFVERWPALAKSDPPLQEIDQLIADGAQLMSAQQALTVCGQEGAVQAVLGQYREALRDNQQALASTIAQLRSERLAPGADVDLTQDAEQGTAFRPEDLEVLPCEGSGSCGMRESLAVSPALLSLFEDPWLIAHQVGMGTVELCYDNVRWTERRAEVPPVRQQAMANYFGRLEFDLHGRFGEREQPVFSLQLTGQQEYEYLFGANTDEVLADQCPRHLIETQVSAELPARKVNLVPRRLTYVTAERTSPSRAFADHWTEGEQWRESFVTGRGVVEIVRAEPTEIVSPLNDQLQAMANSWSQTIYSWLLYDDPLRTDNESIVELGQSAGQLDTYRSVAERIARLMSPQSFVVSPSLRASLRGSDRLLDRRLILSYQGSEVSPEALPALADGHFQDAQAAWRAVDRAQLQAEPVVVSTMLELRALQRRLLASP